jgi:hypothetical protein
MSTWKSSGSTQNNMYWVYTSSPVGMTRTSNSATFSQSLWYENTTIKSFSPEKTYLFKVDVENFWSSGGSGTNAYKSLKVRSPWGASFSYSYSATNNLRTLPSQATVTSLNFYSRPSQTSATKNVVWFDSTYNGFGTQSNSTSGKSVIKSVDIIELDWLIQGWSWATASTQNNSGWVYSPSNNSFTFNHYNPLTSSTRLPAYGYTQSNYISKYISYSLYNLFFTFTTTDSTNGYIDLYLTTNIPSTSYIESTFTASLWYDSTLNKNNQYVGRISGNGNYEFYNLTGDRYLTIVSNFDNGSNLYTMTFSNVVIQGGYQENDNNEKFLFTNSSSYSNPTVLSLIGGSNDATYSTLTTTPQTRHNNGGTVSGATGNPGFFSNIYGQVTNLSQLYSKVGNGSFRSGVWENGVWNSGWRVDEEVHDFNSIIGAFSTQTRNTKWRVLITGPTSSAAQFEIGDKVSIGNIVSININEERNLLKNYFTIINKNETDIVVEFDNTFPIRRIIKDSENHKIRITKNVWLNGGFLNGYFEGIWNNGLFKGYPLITEMDNTHWIDGTFDGGHFTSRTLEYNFTETEYTNGYVGLSFSATHSFLPGDLISIEKDDSTLNPQYNGDFTVTSIIDGRHIVTDIPWGSDSTGESGVARRRTKTGLIQNFNFTDNNVATKNAKQSTTLKDIWKFNSWVDLNYATQSKVTINRDRIYFNPYPQSLADFGQQKYGLGNYTAPNLYGYPTYDVISSKSIFRDIDTFNKRRYSLGAKNEIYQDFLGDISEFNTPFGTTASLGGLDGFFQDGWTFSFSGDIGLVQPPISYTFSRTGNGTLRYQGPTTNFSLINFDNTNINIEKRRYSIIEFDVVDSGSVNPSQASLPNTTQALLTLFNFPRFIDNDGVFTTTTAFPDSSELDYISTNTKKIVYFYNRPGLDIGLLNIAGSYYELDNIKFYEVDSIPFFQYTTEDYVNKSVQVPYQGYAPFIDYNNVNFSFVSNIVISLDSIQVASSNTTFIPSNSNTIGGGILFTNPSR